MANLIIDEPRARSIYPTASSELKTILENTFGKSFFSQKITDRIKTFDDICRLVGTTECAFHTICNSKGLSADEIVDREWKLIIKVLNEGWFPNWADEKEGKYEIWVDMKASSFGLDDVYCYSADSFVGSRLCFKSRELAEFAVKTFPATFEAFYTL